MSACAPAIYYARPTRGTVLDAETHQPIEGAVVVAQWKLIWGARGEERRFELAEATTDGSGGYALPGWGPRLRPLAARFDYLAPRLLVFKHGYQPGFFDNSNGDDRMVHFSEWDGKALPIKPFWGTVKERILQLDIKVLSEACHARDGRSLPLLYDEILKETAEIGHEGEVSAISAKRCRGGR